MILPHDVFCFFIQFLVSLQHLPFLLPASFLLSVFLVCYLHPVLSLFPSHFYSFHFPTLLFSFSFHSTIMSSLSTIFSLCLFFFSFSFHSFLPSFTPSFLVPPSQLFFFPSLPSLLLFFFSFISVCRKE